MTTEPSDSSAGVCEICGAYSRESAPTARTTCARQRATPLTRVLIEDRVVALCESHLAEVEQAGIERLSDLFVLFKDQSGQRGAPERRSPLDRRVFPPRPEGRRYGGGRRIDDSD